MRINRLETIIGVIIMLVFIVTQPFNVSAVGEPDVEISLANPSATAYVAPGQECLVSFTGEVWVEAVWQPSIQYVMVELDADAGGWGVTTPPPLIFSRETKTQSFRITVQVPPETSTFTRGEVTIAGTWEYSPGRMSGDVEPVYATIHIHQYYSLELSCKEPVVQCCRGKSSDIDVTVYNEGNGPDKAHLEIANRDDLLDDNIDARFPTDVVDVPERQERALPFIVTIGSNTLRGEYSIIIEGYSAEAASYGQPHDIENLEMVIEVVREDSEDTEEDDDENVLDNDTGKIDVEEEKGSDESVIIEDEDLDIDVEEDQEGNNGKKLPYLSPFLLIAIFVLTGYVTAVRKKRHFHK